MKERVMLHCPVCHHKLSIDLNRRIALCGDCGWEKNYSVINKYAKLSNA